MSAADPTVPPYVACVDVGSTWTKAALVAADGTLVATASHPTTPPEVLDGLGAALDALSAAAPAVPLPPLASGPGAPATAAPGSAAPAPVRPAPGVAGHVLACSSAGGGLRLAVVGQEPLVSAEAGRRVALSAGARVVHVHAGAMAGPEVRALRAARPDVVLLVGGTDGGDARTLLHNAARLAANRLTVPIVLAGNARARDEAAAVLRGRTVVATDNVLPDVGELNPAPAREAIRAVFLDHVIGGKGLSRGPRLRRLVRLVTPDAVLVGVGRLAAVLGNHDDHAGAVLVVDVGGATTDVYSAVSDADVDDSHAVALPAHRRTVEGDLGMRFSAPGVVADAVAERLVTEPEATALHAAALHRATHTSWVPTAAAQAPAAGRADGASGVDEATGAGEVGGLGWAGGSDRGGEADGAGVDARIAALAAVLAVRRHLRMVDGQLGPRGAGLLVLSGGVFRHATPAALAVVTTTLREDPVLRPVLRHADLRVDTDYVLAPAGLLAHAGHPATADALLGRLTS